MNPITLPLTSLLSAIVWLGSAALAPAQAASTDSPIAAGGLTAPLMYEILVGELSAQVGESGDAYQLLLDAARKTQSGALYERSMEIALRARAGDSALEAAQAWSRAVPDSLDAHRFVLQILIGMNRIADTSDALKRALNSLRATDRQALVEQLPSLYVRATDKKLAQKAVEAGLSGELTAAKTGATAYATIGALRVMAGDTNGALDAARKGAALDPASPAPAELALGLMDSPLPDAETLLLRHLERNAAPDLRMGYIRKLLETQRVSDASNQVMQLTQRSPAFADGWLVRGSLEVPANPAAAQISLEKYLLLQGETEVPNAANPDANTDDDGEVETNPTASAAHRGIVQAYFLLSQLAMQRGDLARATAYLDRIHPPVDWLRLNTQRATVLARQGQLDAGLALIRTTPETSTEEGRAKINAESQLLRDNQQFAAEYTVLSDALKRFPNDADLMYDLAMVADKLGKTDEMETLLRMVISNRPDYPHAYNALGYALADRNIRLPEAKTLISKALEFAPNDPYIEDSLGWVEYRMGNFQTAADILQTAFKTKRDPEIAAHLGEVLWHMNDTAQARAIWKEGMDINASNETLQETVRRFKAW